MKTGAGAKALALAVAVIGVATLTSCGGCGDLRDSGRDGSAAPAGIPKPSGGRVVLDLAAAAAKCDIEHRGLLFDAGTDALVGRFGWAGHVPPGITTVEHDGATWARIAEKKVNLNFVLTEPTPVFVAARTMGQSARSIAVFLDDQPLGTLALSRDQIKISSTSMTTLPVDAGLHTLTLRLGGRGRTDGEPFADLDWLRLGTPDESPATYGAPTLADVIAPAAAFAGVPHRAIALRAPGAIRCSARLPAQARLRVAMGLLGSGEGEAEIRIVHDGAKAETVQRIHLTGGDKATWNDLEVPLSAHAGPPVAVELRAIEAPRGGRVLFGDPAIVVPGPAPTGVPTVRAVVIVALDGVERAELPPWSGQGVTSLPTLSELVATATTFDGHRAPTSFVPAVMASLLTGLPPRGHGLTDLGARLPTAQVTIGGVARDASIRTAMFTGVPTTFRAFGFGTQWERFVENAPGSGDPATAPLDGAAAWIAEVTRDAPNARLLAVVHARGGHPPWDVTSKELAALTPSDYSGMIEPRRAAQTLAKVRQSRARSSVLTPADRDRARALEAIAMAGQDRALGALITALRTRGLWDSTLFVVTGEVASGVSVPLLFGEGADLRETVLTLPLYVHFPNGLFAGQRIAAPTEVYDIARTSMTALGLQLPKESLGRDLAAVASGLDDPASPQFATLAESYSARWGDYVVFGRVDAPARACDLTLDPTCAFDRSGSMPLLTEDLFRRVVAFDLATRAPAERREPVTIEQDMAAALSVWGAGE
jgi:hypothetical protein